MTRALLAAIIILALAVTASGQERGLGGFYDEVGPRYLVFATRGQVRDGEVWREGWKRCTTTVLAADKFLYGVIAAHCVEEDHRFKPIKSYIVFPGKRYEAEVMAYRPGDVRNETRIWRAENFLGQRFAPPGVASPVIGERAYLCGFWETLEWYGLLCVRGEVVGEPGHTWLGAMSMEPVGNIALSMAVFWGFSGGALFVFRGEEWALAGIINAFSMFSSFAFAWSVPPDAMDYIRRDISAPLGKPVSPEFKITSDHYPANYAGWDKGYQELWRSWLEGNESYHVVYNDMKWKLSVQGHTLFFRDNWAVVKAILDGRLALRGKMQDVRWREYEIDHEQ